MISIIHLASSQRIKMMVQRRQSIIISVRLKMTDAAAAAAVGAALDVSL